MNKVYVLAAKRTAIGSFGGSIKDFKPQDLATACAKACLDQVKKSKVSEVIIGNVLGAGYGMNIARQVALNSELDISTPAFTINKVCGSGLKAVSLASSMIKSGEADCVLAGGTESMSGAAYVSLKSRWGARLGNSDLNDLILQDGLTDVFNNCHMGITAENLAEKFSISREEQDEFAYQSQRKASLAIENSYFKDEIVSLDIMKRGQKIAEFSVDEYPRKDASIESLAKLKPAFREGGTVTAGNASGINDGAACLLLSASADNSGSKPIAEILGWASAGVEPKLMGLGPVEAVKSLLKITGTNLSDIDLIESNEAFAAQAIAVNKSLEWDTSKINIAGGAIALGHPIGASGARIITTLIHQLRRENKELGLATLCVGGGQGVAVLVKAV
ncbi:MAG: acetyl-CoA C-acetyltransferase [Bdellovibrionales bacterium]|nr:acetyl-CoA C-acetyltransferase [Bdellovibrionales bacterium]